MMAWLESVLSFYDILYHYFHPVSVDCRHSGILILALFVKISVVLGTLLCRVGIIRAINMCDLWISQSLIRVLLKSCMCSSW